MCVCVCVRELLSDIRLGTKLHRFLGVGCEFVVPSSVHVEVVLETGSEARRE